MHQKHYIGNMEDLNQLKLVLVKKKRTNKWLAEQLGVNQTTVSKWCTNTTQPDLATLKRISELLRLVPLPSAIQYTATVVSADKTIGDGYIFRILEIA